MQLVNNFFFFGGGLGGNKGQRLTIYERHTDYEKG